MPGMLLSYGVQHILRLVLDKILDVGTATLALVDMGSDVFVTIQYWEDARRHGEYPIFFVVSCGILCVSSLASACMLFLHVRELPAWIYGVLLVSLLPPCGLGLLLQLKPQAIEPWLMFRLLFVSIVLPFFLSTLLVWRHHVMQRNKKPCPKLPFKGLVSAAATQLFADGELVLEIPGPDEVEAVAIKAVEADIEPGPYQVLMVALTPPYDETQEQKMLLKGNWILRERNATPYMPEHVKQRIDFDQDKSELYIATDLTYAKQELDAEDDGELVGGEVLQFIEWVAEEEAWKVASTCLGETWNVKHRWVLPDNAHVRMLHPNAVEIYLPVGKGRGERLVIGYMFRESEYFEPVHDASLTLKKYQSWLRDHKAEESDLMVWLGTSDAPADPPMLGACLESNLALQEWLKYSQHLSFRSELSLYESSRQWIRITTQMPFLVETIFEAVPQSLLQTSAMVMYSVESPEDITITQLMSVGISVTSLIAKVYLACDSMVPNMFFFKLACVCYDLLALFYTVTSLWAGKPDDPDATEVFFLTRSVDWASAIYVWVLFIAFFTLWDGGLACIVMVYNQDLSNCDGLACLLWVGLVVIWSLIPIPLSILLMSIRLSWVVALIYYYEDRFRANYSFYREIYEFVHRGEDFDARMDAVKEVLEPNRVEATDPIAEDDLVIPIPDALYQTISSGHALGRALSGGLGRSVSNKRSLYARASSSKALGSSVSLLEIVHQRAEERREWFGKICKWLCCGMFCSPCLFPVVFPVVYSMVYPHLAFYIAMQKRMTLGRPVNPFSLYLYGALVVNLLLSVALSPVAWRFLRFATRVPHASKLMASEDEKVKEVRAVYAKHYEKKTSHRKRVKAAPADEGSKKVHPEPQPLG